MLFDNSNLNIQFDERKTFTHDTIRNVGNMVGIYFIFLSATTIEYPFKQSKLIYIGMSEKKTNSISKRLYGHLEGTSHNSGLINYRKREELHFTFINFEMLKRFWNLSIENLEAFFILDFVHKYGVYPICNNKTGFDVLSKEININLNVDWNYFN